jgi:hypothetical protein
MAVLNNFIRRILGSMSFPRFPVAPTTLIPQVYQPAPEPKPASVPVVINPPPV